MNERQPAFYYTEVTKLVASKIYDSLLAFGASKRLTISAKIKLPG